MKNIIFSLSLLSCSFLSAQSGRIEHLDAMAFDAKMKHIRHTLLDLRNAEDFEHACIQGAINLSWPGKEAETYIKTLKKFEPVYIYSNDTSTPNQLGRYLIDNQFSNAVILDKGFKAWTDLGLKVVKPEKKMPLD